MTSTTTESTALPGYGTLWKRTPGAAVFLLVIFVVAMVAVGILSSLFWSGIGMLVIVIGLPVVVAALFVARAFGVTSRFLLELTGLPTIQEPSWDRPPAGDGGFWATLIRPLRNGHYWMYLLHGMIVNPIVSTITFALTVTWLSVSLGGLTYWFWAAFIPRGGGGWGGEGLWGGYVAEAVPWLFGGLSAWNVEVLLYLLAGILFTITMPWVLNGLVLAHHAIARAMLGRWPSDALIEEVKAEASARGAAVHAEDTAMRQLERDIHDGPQQRLVRLQLDLAALERRAAAGDAEAAAQLAGDARLQAKAALDELRALSSGVAPPLLQDRGLVAALTALAAESPLPVTVEIDAEIDQAVEPGIARNIYFVVAELLTNAVKHSNATSAALNAKILRSTPAALPTLTVLLADNGRGGAHFSPRHGLEGLRDRLHGMRGELVIESPEGGPTTIGAHVPLPPVSADGAVAPDSAAS